MHLFDTNIISELANPKCDENVSSWASKIGQILLSSVTIEEIYFGLNWKPPRPAIFEMIEAVISSENVKIVPVTAQIAILAGQFRGRAKATGKTLTQADMLIASTCIISGAILVTRNIKDFTDLPVAVLNPFTFSGK